MTDMNDDDIVNKDSQKEFDAQKYCNDYKKVKYKRITALIPRKDSAMIEHLAKQKSVSTYIYELIQKDMDNGKD